MELKQYLEILWRRQWVIILTTSITVLVAAGGTSMMTPIYEATTSIQIDPSTQSIDVGGINYVERLLKTYVELVMSGAYRERATQELQQPIPKTTAVSASIVPDTNILKITVEDPDAERAAHLANVLAAILIEENRESRFGRLNPLSILDTAEIPTDPAEPSLRVNVVLGALIGLVAGVGLIFLFEHLDSKLYTTRQIQHVTQLPTLAYIPSVPRKQRNLFVNGQSFQAEVYRHLRTRINMLGGEQSLRTVMITSAEPREGKSTITANLAFAIAQMGHSVIVVDADLRRPTQHQLFQLPNETGLSLVLQGETSLQEALQSSHLAVPNLQVLTSGPLPHNPVMLLGSAAMPNVIEQLEAQFDVVLLDTPSFITLTDASLLAPLVSGVVLVVSRARARQEHVQTVRHHLEELKTRIIGVVINRVEQPDNAYTYYVRK